MALTCGLDHADGDAVITMDGDLQHPPELIPELLRLWEAGNEIVQTKAHGYGGCGFFKTLDIRRLHMNAINTLSKVEITPGGSDFRLMDRIAVDAFKLYRGSVRVLYAVW